MLFAPLGQLLFKTGMLEIHHMRILLIQPPIQDFYDTDVRLQPIGLGHLKAVAKKWAPYVEVIIRDYHQGHGRFPVPIPKELQYLKSYYQYPDKSPFRTFYQYFHFGASFDKIREDIRELAPDAIGISSLFTPYFREALQIAKVAKAEFPHIPVLMGGSHVSACPIEVLSEECVDFIIRGEGERPFVEWIESLEGKRPLSAVSGLGYKKDGQQVLNPIEDNYAINELPIPDLSDLNPENYKMGRKNLIFLVTSRSCPHRCSFCSVHQTFGDNYRRRSVDHVMSEIHQRYQEGYRVIDFEDDNLTFYKKDMKELCQRLIQDFPEGELEFVAMNGISYISLDDELLHLMKRAGFTHLNLALVTSDQFVRQATKRPHTIEKYLEVVTTAHRLGFKIVSYQILGLPNESLDSMVQTLAFAARLPILLGASMFYLTPNTPIAKDFPEHNEVDRFLARLTSMAIESEHFERADIFTLFITTRIIDFLKSFSVDEETSLSEILALPGLDKAQSRGLEILRRLFTEKVLYADLGDRYAPIEKFKYDLFLRVVDEISTIGCQNGARILIRSETTTHTPIDEGTCYSHSPSTYHSL